MDNNETPALPLQPEEVRPDIHAFPVAGAEDPTPLCRRIGPPSPTALPCAFIMSTGGLCTCDGEPVTGFGFAPDKEKAEGEEKLPALPARAEIIAPDRVKVYYPEGSSAPQQLHYA